MKASADHLSLRWLLAFAALSTGTVAALAIFWKFGVEELVDPYLAGEHGVDSIAERWEFVVAACVFSALALVAPLVLVRRLVAERLSSSRLAAAVFNAAPQPMLVCDGQRRVIAANPAFEQLSGHLAPDIAGKSIGFLECDLHDAAFYAAINRSVEGAGAWSGEVHCRRPDASVYVVWLNVTATRDAAGSNAEYVLVLTDITWRKQREEETLHLAMHDALTGLPNRRLFLERLHQVMAAATVGGETVALLFVDLDGFKGINDTRGHAAGDLVLKGVATRLLASARAADMVARLAGDEFVILLRDVDSSEAAAVVARRCLESFSEPMLLTTGSVRIAASIGVALSSPQVSTAEALLELADRLMYAAKRDGQGSFRVHDASPGEGGLVRAA